MCIALKVPTVIEIAKKAISENKSVVIGLQSTGEARTKASVGDQTTVSEFISAPQGILKELVKKAFPLPPIPESILEERRKAALEEKEKNRDRTRKSRHIQNDLYINNINSSYFIDSPEEKSGEDESEDEDYNSDEESANDGGISDDELNGVICYKCNVDDNEQQLLLCDRCKKKGCHTYCCIPPYSSIPKGEWYCDECRPIVQLEKIREEEEKKRKEEEEKKRKEDLLNNYLKLKNIKVFILLN